MVKLSVVVPVYNGEDVVTDFLEELKKVLRQVKTKSEIIVIDDASKDRTFNKLKSVRGIKVIRHPYNKGYGAALKTGTRASKGKYVLFIDGDGEHDPKNIKKMVKHIGKYDMIVGARTIGHSKLRTIAKKILTSFANYLSDVKIPDLNSGLRATRRELLMKYLDSLPNRFSITTTLTIIFIKSGYSVKYVPVNVRNRLDRSKIHPIKDFINFSIILLKTAMLFSPLRIFIPVSASLFLTGLVYMIHDIMVFSDIPDTSIFLLTTSLILFFFGFVSDQISSLKLSRV